MTRGHPSQAEVLGWNDGNEAELAAHKITLAEVRQVWANEPLFVPNIRHRAGDYKMIGLTDGGRALTIVIRYEADGRVLRPITGWDATAGERSRYL
jgi:uncharacterized DUF497 family protein